MNGRAMPSDAAPMLAIVGYIKFLSTGVPAGQQVSGLGVGRMLELTRAADPERGRTIYAQACAVCHNTDGSGILRSVPVPDLGYMVPPLWGSDSFNDGAGMARLISAANFVHFNMPHGTDYLNPQLSPEEAMWPVSSFPSRDRTRSALSAITRTCCRNQWTRHTAPMPTGSARNSTNMGRSRRSASSWRGSKPSEGPASQTARDEWSPGQEN
jgi:cytochrome c